MVYSENKMRNKITFGDATQLIKKVDDACVDLCMLDAPYVNVLPDKWDQENVITIPFIQDLVRVIKDTGSLYVWCGLGEKSKSLFDFYNLFNDFFIFKDMIVWKKQRGIGKKRGWMFAREELLWFVKSQEKFIWYVDGQYTTLRRRLSTNRLGQNGKSYKTKYGRITNVWADINEPRYVGGITKKELYKDIIHPAQKPVKAIERILSCHTRPGDLVLDCFSGSGTTAVACKQNDRDFIAFENDPQYFEDSVKRLKGKIKPLF